MKKKLAFVLGGGGSRGAMQAGALRALLEAGYQPDLVTGSSIGAANGAFLAVHGYSLEGIQKLIRVWETTIHQDLLPTNLWWQTMRAFFKRAREFSQDRIRDFAIANGLTPDLKFSDLHDIKLYMVAADLNAGCPVVFGIDPHESVLESMLASMALPPWLSPRKRNGRYLMDGGAVSNLPIETALHLGATEIIALDLFDFRDLDASENGLRPFLWKLDKTVENRQIELEMELAEARGVPVKRVPLAAVEPIPLWDFRRSGELIEHGYEITRQAIVTWQAPDTSPWWSRLSLKTMLEDLIEVLD